MSVDADEATKRRILVGAIYTEVFRLGMKRETLVEALAEVAECCKTDERFAVARLFLAFASAMAPEHFAVPEKVKL
jgi:hypothetical protein